MRAWPGPIGFLLVAAAMPAAAEAQTLSQGLGNCLAIVSSVQRLGCYDRLAHDAAAPPGPVGASPPQAPTAQQFGAENLPRAAAGAPPRLDTITAGISDFKLSTYGKFTVTLTNGQVWRQEESDETPVRFKPAAVHAVTISRGFSGSYNLTFDRFSIVYKVERVR